MNTIEDLNTVRKFKHYYTKRNGALHCQFKVDLAVELSPTEEAVIQSKIEEKGKAFIQDVLKDYWDFFVGNVQKEVVDGLKLADRNDARDGRVYKGTKKC